MDLNIQNRIIPRLLLTILEAAQMVGMSVGWIRKKLASGELPCIKLGRATRIELSALEKFIEARRVTMGKTLGTTLLPGGLPVTTGKYYVVENKRG